MNINARSRYARHPRDAPPPPYIDPDTAPFIYIDLAPMFGVLAGAIQSNSRPECFALTKTG